jgi:hypothetical protein
VIAGGEKGSAHPLRLIGWDGIAQEKPGGKTPAGWRMEADYFVVILKARRNFL